VPSASVFLAADEVAAGIEQRRYIGLQAVALGLDEGCTQRPDIVQCVRFQRAQHRGLGLRISLQARQGRPGQVGQQGHALIGVIDVALFAGGGAGCQHARVGDAPLVAGEPVIALGENGVVVDLAEIPDLLLGVLVDHLGRGHRVEVGEDAVQHFAHVRHGRRAVRGRVVRLHQVQRRCHVVERSLRGSIRRQRQRNQDCGQQVVLSVHSFVSRCYHFSR